MEIGRNRHEKENNCKENPAVASGGSFGSVGCVRRGVLPLFSPLPRGKRADHRDPRWGKPDDELQLALHKPYRSGSAQLVPPGGSDCGGDRKSGARNHRLPGSYPGALRLPGGGAASVRFGDYLPG